MKLVTSRAYEAINISVSQLLLMNRAEVLQQYPFYALSQKGPVGRMELFLQYVSRIYPKPSQTRNPINNIVILALSTPVQSTTIVTENLSSEGINIDNYYPTSVDDFAWY